MRRAYLELLKLCLPDLAGAGTVSVGRTEDGRVLSRELRGEGLRLRAAGMDWPLQGLTMVGLDRLDDLQACVESVVGDGVGGDLIETGAWRGGASILMRATLDSLGADDRTVWVADSFRGFPTAESDGAPEDPERDDLAVFDFLAIPLEEVREHFARFGCEQGVEFVPGFFEETMPGLRGGRWSLVRLDGDSYEATRLTLETLYPGLAAGGYLIVDDYGALEECRRAVDEFREEEGISEPLVQVDWTCMRWRRQSEPAAAGEGLFAGASPRPAAAEAAPRRQEARIPSLQEIELNRELATLRSRLASAESELGRGRGPRAWLRRRPGRRG